MDHAEPQATKGLPEKVHPRRLPRGRAQQGRVRLPRPLHRKVPRHLHEGLGDYAAAGPSHGRLPSAGWRPILAGLVPGNRRNALTIYPTRQEGEAMIQGDRADGNYCTNIEGRHSAWHTKVMTGLTRAHCSTASNPSLTSALPRPRCHSALVCEVLRTACLPRSRESGYCNRDRRQRPLTKAESQ